MDITNLSCFRSNIIDKIYACHILEHFPKKYINNIINEWNRVLKSNGTLVSLNIVANKNLS